VGALTHIRGRKTHAGNQAQHMPRGRRMYTTRNAGLVFCSKKQRGAGMGFTRRELLQLSTAGAAALGARMALPELISGSPAHGSAAVSASTEKNLYASLLQSWCDGLVASQVTGMADPIFNGGLLCAACALIHGRCGDAVYPLLRVAHSTGDEKYLRAALAVYEWSERTVSRADGSWVNDVSLSNWQGITVFHSIALAEALAHHSTILYAHVRARWTSRLALAAKFLDSFITIETGNINYPVTASLAFLLCGQVLVEPHYIDRARALAHQVIEQQFTPAGFLFGEGHPLNGISPKGCRPVDLGYNIEESLSALALYAKLANDQPVLDQVIAALKTHIEFMLPDGAWDNSWGTRNYKWSWWGSRTSDGCHPGLVLLSDHDPRFREAARRNLELMAACTDHGLLYGGPDYDAHGDPACVHHTFTHAKALATVLDRAGFPAETSPRPSLPRDEPYGLKSFSDIGTRLAAIGPWRATVTEYDWVYEEHVQAGGGGAGGGHVSGGALSLLFHRQLGPVLTASMTQYQMIEISNQQAYRDSSHIELTPRIECAAGETFTSVNDLKATLTAGRRDGSIVFEAHGRLLTASRQAPKSGDIAYHFTYTLNESHIEIAAAATGDAPAPLRLILPVLARSSDRAEQPDPQTIRVTKDKGALTVRTDAPAAFDPIPPERTFNLVPGFEAIPLQLLLEPGKEVRVRLEATTT
jgi:hypothetical protein